MSLLRRLSLAAAALLFLASSSRADVPALALALDTPSLSWNTGGDVAWTSQTGVTSDGVDAARATGLALLDSESWIETTVSAPGFLSWKWRLDLDPGSGSVLELLVGSESEPARTLYSSDDWIFTEALIDGSGPVKIRWRLRRLVQADTPSPDAACLDTVAFTPFGPPVLLAHSDLTPRGFTAHWNTLPQAVSYAIEISSSADFAVSELTSPVTAPATAYAITGLAPGTTYHYRVVAYGPEGISAVSAARNLATPAVVRPTNDAFASATPLAGPSGSVNATTLEATTEPDEPSAHADSVWFSWTAPSSGLWRFQTSASENSSPLLHVYSGSALADLDPTPIDNSGQENGSARVEFTAIAGRVYRIALDSAGSAQGPSTLSWELLVSHAPPGNDAFASALSITGLSGVVDATNLHSTTEAGETSSAFHSIWFSWKAPASGVLGLDTTGGAIAPVLSVWSGVSLSGLTLLVSDSAPAPLASRVSLPVVKDAIYRISLDGQSGAQGALRLAWTLAVPSVSQTITPPDLADLPVDAPPLNLQAFASSGLPVSYALVSGPASLEGEILALSGQPGLVKIRASQPGDGTYLPAEITFQFTVQAPPANDLASTPQTLANASGSIDPDLRFATSELGDAYPARRSLWYRWTASATGILTVNTSGGAIPVTLSVFTGQPGAFDPFASDTRSGVRPRLELPVVAGTTYTIALDTVEDAAGSARLAWSFSPPALLQTIDFPALPDLGVSAPPFLLEADASSGLPVRFTLVSGPATLVGNLVTLAGKPGTVSIRASQAGDSYHKPASDVVVSFAVRPPPANDNASAAVRLTAASGSVNGSNIDAGSEAFDPAPANRSVWWVWTAPSTGQWTVDTAGGAMPVTLSILSGATPSTALPVAADLRAGAQGRLTVPVEKGETYWIVVDSLDERQGAVKLAWSLVAPAREQTILFDQALPDLVVGDAAPVLSPAASSGLPVQVAVVSGPAMIVDGALVLAGKPGKITLRATQAGDAFYKPAAPVLRVFQIAALPPIKITLSDLRQTYDGGPRPVLALADPDPRVRELAVTYNGSPEPPVDAGTYTVVATADNSRATAKLVIAKIPLLVTAHDQYRFAGEENPPLTFGYSGFAPGDDQSSLLRAPVARTSAKVGSPGGRYPIRVAGGTATNYTFTYAPGILVVDTFSGRHEGLLYDASARPVGKLEFTVASSGRAFTGRLLLARESAPLAFKGDLDLSSPAGLAGASLAVGPYRLAFDLVLEGRFTATLDLDGGYFAAAPSGRRVFVPPAKPKLAWSGAHTVLLSPVSDFADAGPAGSGHATAAIDAKGNLKLAGRLGDHTPFTANLAPDGDGAYRLFALPYPALRDSYLSGEVPLFAHPETARFPGRRHVPASAGVTLTWTRAPASAAKAYPAGFGPLTTTLTLDPWTRPATAFPVSITFSPADLDFGALSSALPTDGRIAPGGAFTLLAPLTTPANLSRFTFKVAPATGAFSGSFVLSDQVAPAPAKAERRTIAFQGVLRSPPSDESGPGSLLGAGSFLLSPLSSSDDAEHVSGEIRLGRP
jgi:hypothetical protein